MSRSAGPAVARRDKACSISLSRHGAKLDVGRDVRGRRQHLIVGNARDVVLDRAVHVVQRADRPLGGRAAARADRRGALRRASPAAFQFVQRRVELAPLAACEESPLQGVLQTIVVRPCLAPRDLRAGANDVHAVEQSVVPGPIVGSLADPVIELLPVVGRERLCQPYRSRRMICKSPEATRVADQRQDTESPPPAGRVPRRASASAGYCVRRAPLGQPAAYRSLTTM